MASIRPATRQDLAGIVALLTRDAEWRRSLDPLLWRIAADARARIEQAVNAALEKAGAPMGELWLVAEHAGRIAGVAHAMMVPVPPIYDGAAGPPGLLLDDCCMADDALADAADDLLVATEAALKAAGAPSLVASCMATGPSRQLYERHGYQPVTLYMVKHDFSTAEFPSAVRPAGPDDVPAIVTLSARHRQTLAELRPQFWYIHPDADRRFDYWMRRSLTFTDRDMLVAGAMGAVHGYIIAQPCSPLLVPLAHEVAGLGVIDDFYDVDFADGDALLAAAESAFARRAVDSALVVCPAAWSSKVSFATAGLSHSEALDAQGSLTAAIFKYTLCN